MMSKLLSSSRSGRQPRADGARCCSAILDAARRVWSMRPEASIETIASEAGVARQTVYAHYTSREVLLSAVVDRAREDTLAAIDAALAEDVPTTALTMLLKVSWQTLACYPFLLHDDKTHQMHVKHEPVVERLENLIGRGQDRGDFDRQLSPAWLVTAMTGLMHAAHEEVVTGRMTVEDASVVLERSILRLVGLGDALAATADP